jgi:hypothetical protein
MLKLRIFYIASLVILGLLLVFAVYKPMNSSEQYSLVTWESIIEGENQWIVQFDIINHEQRDMDYYICWVTGEDTYEENVSIKDGGVFTYIHHIYPRMVEKGKVGLVVYKEGGDVPFIEREFHPVFN